MGKRWLTLVICCCLWALSATNGQRTVKPAKTCPLELSDGSPTVFDGPLDGYRYPRESMHTLLLSLDIKLNVNHKI
jgi:hypothetical protein